MVDALLAAYVGDVSIYRCIVLFLGLVMLLYVTLLVISGGPNNVDDGNNPDGNKEADKVCANCGKVAADDIKLKICTACKFVRYCSVDCQKSHWPQHKKACKKRVREIRDNQLFSQPEMSHLGECPICCLPHSIDQTKLTMNTCCCKFICNGCDYASTLRDLKEGLEQRCPYCRETSPYTDEECEQNYMKRVKANDPLAIFKMGLKRQEEGDIGGAIQYWTKAAKLGGIEAHQNLSLMYIEGGGVEKDMKKAVYHMEEAAIGGHPIARFNLGNHEWDRGRDERAMKHYIIAAKLGLGPALDQIKDGFKEGSVSKEDYEAALRGYQAAVDEAKSQQRDAAEVHFKGRRLSTN